MRSWIALAFIASACTREAFPPTPPAQAEKTVTAPPAAPDTAVAEPAAPTVNGPKLPFVDEASQDPSLVAFRERFLAAVRAKDRDAVIALTDPNVRTSFGDAAGRADLIRRLEGPELWQELEWILTHGGTFRGEGGTRSFWAPYVYSTYPDAQDAFTTMAVIADDVPLREQASPDARVLATLSRDIVEADAGDRGEWTAVTTADGRKGFVRSTEVRSPIDYRAGFMKSGNGWTMTALVAGD